MQIPFFWNAHQLLLGLAHSEFNTLHQEAFKRLVLFAGEASCAFEDEVLMEKKFYIPLLAHMKM